MSQLQGQRRTRVIAVDPVSPAPSAIAEAAGVLRAGGLVAFPTETVYGLGANALDQHAVLSIFEAKGRDRDDPLIVHIARRPELAQVAQDVPALAVTLADRFWPGPLTLVLRRSAAIAPAVSAGLETVAVRVPSHPIASALIRAAGVPVAAPSANRFMRTSATTARHVLDDLDGRIDVVLDGGQTPAGIESTVVAVEGGRVRLLRRGAVPVELLAEVVDSVPGAQLLVPDTPDAGSGSPGMLMRHYAPAKPLTLVDAGGQAGRAVLVALIRDAIASGQSPGLLLTTGDARAMAALEGVSKVADLGPEDDDAEMAHRLFAAMRELDTSAGTTMLLARIVADRGLGAAVNDRLRRAATKIVSAPA